jgi:membrane AbrB-like protein
VPPQGFTTGGPGLSSLAPLDALILVACGIVGYFGGKILRFPASRFTGPLTASAIAHLTGLTASKPPGELIVLAQIILGSSLGCRYVGVRLGEVMGTVRVSIVSALLLLGSALLFAYGIHLVTGFNTKALVLSLSPGGLVEMTLIALALGIDVAFITTHHLVRITISVFLAPTVFAVAHRKGLLRGPKAEAEPDA